MITRILVLLVSVALFATNTSSQDNIYKRSVDFDIHWNSFIRELFGCPKTGGTDATVCQLQTGHINYAAFLKARREAMKLFDLTESK